MGDPVRYWPDFTVRVLDLRAISGDLTLGTVHLTAAARADDVPVEWTVCAVGRWKGSKCVWWGTFETQDEALEAVGLSEQDAHADS